MLKIRQNAFPKNLETQYSRLMSKFMEALNDEYFKLLRVLLKESDDTFVLNSLHVDSYRFNAPNLKKFQDKLKAIRKSISGKKVFKNIFESMKGIFSRVDRDIVKKIKGQFSQKKFPIPELELKVDSESLKNAVEQNVSLIGAIKDVQVEEMEKAVLSAVTGGANFDTVIEEVQEQSDRGKAYAEFVARDQVGKTFAAVNEERQKAVGFPGYMWATTDDNRVRSSHAKLDDTFHLWSQPPLVEGSGSQPARNLHPGEDYQCRCEAIPSFGPE